MAKQLRNIKSKLDKKRKQKQTPVHAKSKMLQKRTKGLKADLAQMQTQDLSTLDKQQQTMEAKQERSSTSSKGFWPMARCQGCSRESHTPP